MIKFILKDSENIGFATCLQEFLSNGIKGFDAKWSNWTELWSELCLEVDENHLVAKALIYNTSTRTCNISDSSKLWEILIESYQSADRQDELVELISQNIELLQQTGFKEDLISFFKEKFLMKVIKKLHLDNLIWSLLDKPKEQQKANINILETALKDHDIRFFATFILIKKAVDNDRVSEVLLSLITSLPNLIDKKGQSDLDKVKRREYYRLDNWIGIN